MMMSSGSIGKYLRAGLVPAGVLVTALAAACSPPAEMGEIEEYVRVVNVQVHEVAPETFTAAISVTGSVEALYDVTIVSEEGGVVEEFLVERGATVRRGQPIARMDSEILEAQLEEGRASAQLAREQWERQRRLWETEEIGTELAYIQARENARMREASVRTLEARLARKTIRSPVDGTFEEYYVEAGEYALPAAPFARFVSIDEVKLTAGVPERFATDVRVGTEVEVSFENCPEEGCVETITFVGDTVDPDNRTFLIEMRHLNRNRVLKPGMVATMKIRLQETPDALVVPQEAVMRIETGYQLFVIEEVEGRLTARARTVTLGPNRADRVVVIEGLAAGDRVVTVGQLRLTGGDQVQIVDSNGDLAGTAAPGAGR